MPDTRPAYIQRLRTVQARLPINYDRGDLTAMLDEHRDWTATRARANAMALD